MRDGRSMILSSARHGAAIAAAAVACASAAVPAVAAEAGGSRGPLVPANFLSVPGSLAGVTVISSSDAWAVGLASPGPAKPLLAHWDGRRWAVVSSGALPPLGQLTGVAKFPGGAWVVGLSHVARGRPAAPLIARLAGTAVRRVPTPRVRNGVLEAVAAAGRADAWAVGYVGGGPALIMGWNGKAWTRARVPRRITFLGGVAATSPVNAWAAGSIGEGFSPVIVHWNGSRWSRAAIPSISGGYRLVSMAAVSATNAWAVGYTNGISAPTRTVILHWNGRTWRRARSRDPQAGGEGDGLAAVAASSARNGWAVGNSFTGPFGGPFTERWDGTSWKTVTEPVVGVLASIAIGPSGRAWAVGMTVTRTLIVRWNGIGWH